MSFVGAMKIARNIAVSGRHVEWYGPFPAPSLRELARPPGVTEGVSFDGCSMPMVYKPAHIDSEIFERLRSSGYTPSVSRSLDSSLREGAGNGPYHSTCRPETAILRAIFIAPTKLKNSNRPKTISRFPPENDTGWARAPTYRNHLKAQLKKELDKYAGH